MIKDLFVYIDRDVSLSIDEEIKMPMCFLLIILTARYHISTNKKGGVYKIFSQDDDYMISRNSKEIFKIEYNGNMWFKNKYTSANIFIDNYHFKENNLAEGYKFVPEWEQFTLVDKISSESPENGDVYSDIGKRDTMEDSHFYERRNIVKFYMIADGHGGSRTSKYLEQHLCNVFFNNIEKNIKNTLEKTFLEIDKTLFDLKYPDGSTCLVSIIINKNFYFANLGDSRGILIDVSDKKIVLSTRDHKPTDPDEFKRINKVGGQVFYKRVQGRLAVSRAFGDNEFKTKGDKYQGINAQVSPLPEIFRFTFDPSHKYILVMACDGLWDVFDNNQVLDFVLSGTTSQELVEKAIRNGSTDNVTVMMDKI